MHSALQQDEILNCVDGSEGYFLGKMTDNDLNTLIGLIREQYLARILCHAPQHSSMFYQQPISQYHQYSHLLDHQQLWPKRARILGPLAVSKIKQLTFYRYLTNELGETLISGEDGSGWEEIYWRIVRPGVSDIGGLHADKWFWELGHGEMPRGLRRIKIWIAIVTVAGLSGLRLIPGSHLKHDWNYHGEVDSTGKQKPKFEEKAEDLDIVNIPTSAGDYIVFHDGLIHAGMENKSILTRVSLEATLFIKDKS